MRYKSSDRDYRMSINIGYFNSSFVNWFMNVPYIYFTVVLFLFYFYSVINNDYNNALTPIINYVLFAISFSFLNSIIFGGNNLYTSKRPDFYKI